MGTVRYLDESMVTGMSLGAQAMVSALENAFLQKAKGLTLVHPKAVLDIDAGHSFQSLCAGAAGLGYAVNKWFGMAPGSGSSAAANIDAILALNEYSTGTLLALIDGRSVTAIRTAAMSALAASRFVSPDSRSMGFVGCGVQAHSHLVVLKELFPAMESVYAFSPSGVSAETLCQKAERMGMSASVLTDPRGLVESSDVVVSSVPMARGFKAFLDASWLREGAFVAAVDVGRSWLPASIGSFDLLVTDSLRQSNAKVRSSGPTLQASYDLDLAGLMVQSVPQLANGRRRTLFAFQGHALADLAIAALVYERAVDTGVGLHLNR